MLVSCIKIDRSEGSPMTTPPEGNQPERTRTCTTRYQSEEIEELHSDNEI